MQFFYHSHKYFYRRMYALYCGMQQTLILTLHREKKPTVTAESGHFLRLNSLRNSNVLFSVSHEGPEGTRSPNKLSDVSLKSCTPKK